MVQFDVNLQNPNIRNTLKAKNLIFPSRQSGVKRILLIVPPLFGEKCYGNKKGGMMDFPQLGLAYIASSLIDQGHHVEIYDAHLDNASDQTIMETIERYDPDVVGMTMYITNIRQCFNVCRLVKNVNSHIKNILGGPQVTIFPKMGFNSPDVDIVVVSEGEVIIRNVMNALDDGDLSIVKGIWYRDEEGIIRENESEFLIKNIDDIPFPAIYLYDLKHYHPSVHIRGYKVAHLITSRGCPFNCSFCNAKLTFGRQYRFHSASRVLHEIRILQKMGFDGFQFYDDAFTVNPKRVLTLCDELIKVDSISKLQWTCSSRTDNVSEKLLKKMKQAGCYLISYGCESGDDRILKNICKGTTVEKNFEAIRITNKVGISSQSYFMIGLPGESEDHINKTIDFAISSGVKYAEFSIAEPIPGTEFWAQALEYGRFDTTGRFSNFFMSEYPHVWVPNNISRENLERLFEKAFMKFYYRPQKVMELFSDIWKLPPKRIIRFIKAGTVILLNAVSNYLKPYMKK